LQPSASSGEQYVPNYGDEAHFHKHQGPWAEAKKTELVQMNNAAQSRHDQNLAHQSAGSALSSHVQHQYNQAADAHGEEARKAALLAAEAHDVRKKEGAKMKKHGHKDAGPAPAAT
jgi:hypothetical protein